MAPRIIAFLITLFTNIIVGISIFFVMIIAMNGYSESDATWGLGFYIVVAILISVGSAVASYILVSQLRRRQFSAPVSILIAVLPAVGVGVVLMIVSSLTGIGIAEFVRVNY